MFERNRVDSGTNQQSATAAEVTLTSGEVLTGRVLTSAARAFPEALNGSAPFLEFEPFNAPRRFLAKAAILSIELLETPRTNQLSPRGREAESFDPHAVLGVARSAGFEEIRQAYLRMSKLYHPDRYSAVELPREVRDYLSAMAASINTAYSALERAQTAQKERTSNRVEAIYTSPPRTGAARG
jgi:hypothetical protein